MQLTKKHKIHTHRPKHKRITHMQLHTEMGPMWQNPIQRTVRTAHLLCTASVYTPL